MHARARVAAGEVTHDLRDPAELLRREIAARDLHLDGVETLLALREHVRLDERIELARVAVRRAADVRRGCVLLLVVLEQQRRRVEVALVGPVALELLVDHRAELVDADLVDEELQARAGAVGAQPVLAVEDAQDSLGDLEVVAVLHLHEVV